MMFNTLGQQWHTSFCKLDKIGFLTELLSNNGVPTENLSADPVSVEHCRYLQIACCISTQLSRMSVLFYGNIDSGTGSLRNGIYRFFLK